MLGFHTGFIIIYYFVYTCIKNLGIYSAAEFDILRPDLNFIFVLFIVGYVVHIFQNIT